MSMQLIQSLLKKERLKLKNYYWLIFLYNLAYPRTMMNEEDVIKCDRCGALVYNKAFGIHQIMCKKNNQPEPLPKKKQSSNPFKKIINFFSGQDDQQEGEQKNEEACIPCLECGESFPFSVYAIHEQECVGHQLTLCKGCGLKYPTFLIEEHYTFCENNLSGSDQVVEEEEQVNLELNHLIGQLALQKGKAELDDEKGLTPDQISKLKPGLLRQPEDCPVCCTPMMMMKKRLIRLNCSHIFHHGCISAWLRNHPLCPMCRTHALKH